MVTVFLFLSDFNDLNNVARLECERISVIEKNVTIPIFCPIDGSTLLRNHSGTPFINATIG